MEKQIHLRISKKLYGEIEKNRIENNLEDKQDLIRKILEEKLIFKKTFREKLKYLFKN